MHTYYRPIPVAGPGLKHSAPQLAGGWCHFEKIECLVRGEPPRIIPADTAPGAVLARLCAPRAHFAGLDLSQPRLMGIVNVTPDSFSDGGRLRGTAAAVDHARAMLEAGADLLDIGGESTRPGAHEVPVDEEIARVAPVIEALRAAGLAAPISVDTRKSAVARAALAAGGDVINDVSGFRFDPGLAGVAAETGAPVILMHSVGTPDRMQDNPTYDNALLDIYDALEAAVQQAEAHGIPRARILVDPGIGFGKTDAHNRAALERISLFHALGCGVMLGVSRKGFVGRAANISEADKRDAASAALGLWAIGQGVQVLRVHDILTHKQAIALWQAVGAA